MHSQSNLMEHKSARVTTGTVLYKRHVSFGKDENFYTNDEGRRVAIEDWRRRSGEDRAYYAIDNLDQVPASHRAQLLDAERDREKKFGPRFTIADRKLYVALEPGNKVQIVYRWITDTELEIIEVKQVDPS